MSTGKSLRILIVEDEILIALELESLLQDAGHTIVDIAACSREAVASGADLRPDLAFVDIHLSDGPTGVEVARRLAEQGITVLFMTANAKRIPEDCAGAHGVISKPYTERGVHEAIDYIRTVQSGKAAPQVEETMTFVPFAFAGADRPTRA